MTPHGCHLLRWHCLLLEQRLRPCLRPFPRRSYSFQKRPWRFARSVSFFHRRRACEQTTHCTLMRTCRCWGPAFSLCVFRGPPPPPPAVSVSLAFSSAARLLPSQQPPGAGPSRAPPGPPRLRPPRPRPGDVLGHRGRAVVIPAASCLENPVESWTNLLSPFRPAHALRGDRAPSTGPGAGADVVIPPERHRCLLGSPPWQQWPAPSSSVGHRP